MGESQAKQPNARRCISCRKVAPKDAFWRVVRVYPSRTVQLDWGMGRSAYLCATESCLKAARHKNRLGRALKTAIPETIYQSLELRLGAGALSAPPKE
ncbi:YlxR family protein [Oscillatoria sp. FACHB-1406]|uniref:YlxR family protein n=1 Tax=Oscillatoria sp. FACHB-1406 TaxID=2692846 RepID=UPI0016897352|nr:YlxR family protein [Oscillatoria sp. FACHB-1406]MBD2576405.1 YlxR family protein [Oscillatoria sp. FACHB-1406]